MGVVETPTSEDHELCSPRDAASALLNPPGYRVVEAVDGPLGVLNRPGFDAASFLEKDAPHAEEVPGQQRDRATRMVLDRLKDYPSVWAAAQGLGPKLGVGPETLRKWVVRAQVDQGQRPGPSSEELAEIKRLRAENRDLKEANEILKAASIFFARELDPRHR